MQIYLTDGQRRRIAGLAQTEASSKAAVVRRILDRALGIADETRDRLALVDATAGVVRDAPGWETWLAAVRSGSTEDRLRSAP